MSDEKNGKIVEFPQKDQPPERPEMKHTFPRFTIYPVNEHGERITICPFMAPAIIPGPVTEKETPIFVEYMPCEREKCEVWDTVSLRCGAKVKNIS